MIRMPFPLLLRTTVFVGILTVSFSLAVSRVAFAEAQTKAPPVVNMVLPDEGKSVSPAFPGNDAVSFADAYGERETGEHGTFGRFPPNFETPPHIHSHSYRALVLRGEMTNPFEGETDPPVLRPGSFWSVEANKPHTTACVSDTPCEFFMYGEESFDFVPVN